MKGSIRALRFLAGWLRHPRRLQQQELELEVAPGVCCPATLVESGSGATASARRPGWVVLHGMTRPGRRHPGLIRFAGALAAAGVRVLIPEVRAWTELRFAPEEAERVIRAAVRHLASEPGTRGPVVLAGFSFGGPQALRLAADPELARHLSRVVSWGGYHELQPSVDFAFRGRHKGPDGSTFEADPDPYGRWVLGANYLAGARPGPAGQEAAGALQALARKAGDLQIPADDPRVLKHLTSIRQGLSEPADRLMNAFAVPPEDPGSLTGDLVSAARGIDALLDPFPLEQPIPVPVHLLHGRDDRMIPFTQTLHLARHLADRHMAPAGLHTGITGLFAHSGGAGGPGPSRLLDSGREGLVFFRILQRLLSDPG